MHCKNQPANQTRCNCTYEPCPRKGICCECIEYHRAKKQLPACYFDQTAEATWDRSIRHFIRCQS